MTANVSSPFPTLEGAQFMLLTTHRRSGDAVPTTVWFAEQDGKLYVTTRDPSGKVKRIRNNEAVLVAPSDRMGTVAGPATPARARTLAPEEFPIASAALAAKYGAQYQQITATPRQPGDTSERAFIEITPTER